jgi:hypothetical protein
MADENRIRGACYVLKYWCGPPGCNKNFPMCSHGMLDRYELFIVNLFSAVGLLMKGENYGTEIRWCYCFFFFFSVLYTLQLFDMFYMPAFCSRFFPGATLSEVSVILQIRSPQHLRKQWMRLAKNCKNSMSGGNPR